jgi:chemotaxis protein MotB
MNRRGFNKKDSGDKAPGWITTYSDLMSLLLTFFILLYSMSNVDAAKFKNVSDSLTSILNGLGQTSIIEEQITDAILNESGNGLDGLIKDITVRQEILDMYDKVQDYVNVESLDAKVSVTMNRRGVFVDIKEAILFEPGSAEIKETGIIVLKQLEGLINDFDNDIVIEGHTDNIPMKTATYPSNWELSTGRAVSVVRFLSEVERVDPKRLSAIGYSEYRPIANNDSRENRAINRRVNILIIFDEESDDANGK